MNCMNSFVSDGVYFYGAQNGQKCYRNPLEACQNPQRVLITNGNNLIARCDSIRLGGIQDDDPPLTASFEMFEMPKSPSYLIPIIILILIIITCAIIYLK